ncbi:hypothetical protein [Anabaenopsis elenkinii]|uniref:Rhodanese domain-containing protein n=1 Tax=Anabaenopsis elenkinii CCIBt3563 TaxID=2779889 RepID=A0A7S6U3A9_9CYAN|nr:hypothetical protein [Anabaenopsis elenkinii]QOV23980.1 hypothetical protein IM676_06820 [Anabaenopsis elenkinii CCIBt3563]
MIPIHEFSTGIKAERTPNGGWVSLGFTGKYMNATLDPIPLVVKQSIANLEFVVIIAAFTKEPAIIGRVVGTGENSWGVIAVVTGAKDKNGRTLSLSLYRYFLTPGANHLRYLLAWWESQGKPTFNPFDSKNIGQYAEFDPASAHPSDYDPTANNLELVPTKPTLLQPQQYNLTTIHTLAIKKHNLDKTQPISWAFNVEALKKPHSFQIIQPAFLRAYENLEREISKLPQSPTDAIPDQILDEIDQIVNQTLKTEISQPPPSPTDPTPEQVSPKKTLDKASTQKAVKAAIQSLINISQVKPPAVETIIDTLENQQLNTQEWYSLFDAEGATTAITEKIYSSPLARLMTLRAIVIPETLPEFLGWLNIQPGKQPSEAEKTSLQFQVAIRGYFPTEKLTAGIKLLIPYLLKGEISPESVHWLFLKDRVWAVCRSQLINDVRYDLELIYQQSKAYRQNFNNLKFPLEMWQELIPLVGNLPQLYYIKEYWSLAQLFYLLKDYQLCIYFYQISQGDVDKKLFYQAFPNVGTAETSANFLGLTITREITLSENIKLIRFKVSIAAVFSLLVLSGFGGYYLAGGFSSWREDIKTLENETKNIAETKQEINKIVDNLTRQYPQEEVIKKLRTEMDFKELNYKLINPPVNPPHETEIIAKLESAINDIRLSQKISAYHQKLNTPRNPQKFNLWSNQPDMRSTYKRLENKVSEALKADVIEKALNPSNFKKTTDSLTSIIREITPRSPLTRSVEQLLITRLGLTGKIENLQNFTQQQKKDLVEAIHKYQIQEKLPADGIIDKSGETYNRLKQDIGNQFR